MDVSLVQDEAVARACFEDFNHWKRQTNRFREMANSGRPLRDPKFTDERRLIMLEFVVWCREHDVDARFFVYALYAARNWLFTVKLEHIQSEGILKRMKAGHFREAEPYRKRLIQFPVGGGHARDTLDPNVDISVEVENRKERFLQAGQSILCLDQMAYEQAPTYGYHPKSSVCRACPIKAQCSAALTAKFQPIDVVALRDGRVTPEQASLIYANR